MDKIYNKRNDVGKLCFLTFIEALKKMGLNLYHFTENPDIGPLIRIYLKNDIQDLWWDILSTDKSSPKIFDNAIKIINHMHYAKDEYFIYEFFIGAFDEFPIEFMDVLKTPAADYELDYMSSICSNIVDNEFPDSNDEEKKDICHNFTTVEDYIRAHPRIYNILHDIHHEYMANIFRHELPNEIIDLLRGYILKYNRSHNDMWTAENLAQFNLFIPQ